MKKGQLKTENRNGEQKQRTAPCFPFSVSVSVLSSLFSVLCFLVPVSLFAGTQSLFEADIAPDLKVTWVVVDDFPAKESQARAALKKASLHAREILDRLDPLNPMSELSLLLAKEAEGVFPVSPDLAKILAATQEIAKTMNEPLAKKIKVDLEKNEVKMRVSDVIINIEPLLKGYLVDTMMNDLQNEGFQNSFLEAGGVFVTRGQDFNGPWKIQVADATTENAYHSFLYKAIDTAAATINQQYAAVGIPSSDIKSVTIFTKGGACQAQGLATALYAMGLDQAKKWIEGVETIDRAVLIDVQGRFHQWPEGDK